MSDKLRISPQDYRFPCYRLPNGIRITSEFFWEVIYPAGLMTIEEFYAL